MAHDRLELRVVAGGDVWCDGGAMFGVVPKPLWQRYAPPDDRNRIQLATNCLLIRGPVGNFLCDTGYGGKAPPKVREIFRMAPGEPLVENLAALGLAPADIHGV